MSHRGIFNKTHLSPLAMIITSRLFASSLNLTIHPHRTHKNTNQRSLSYMAAAVHGCCYIWLLQTM